MATVDLKRAKPPWIPRQKPWNRRDGVFRFTVEQAYRLAEMGFFDDRRVELIEGVLHEMMSLPPHTISTELAMRWAMLRFADLCVRVGSPLDVGRKSLPEPDLAVVPGQTRDYVEAHPKTAFLVLEVSDSTLRKDRNLKAHLYAAAGLADYWIVNLRDRQLEIHRSPGPDPARKGRFHYAEISILPAEGHAAPLFRPDALVAVADLLP